MPASVHFYIGRAGTGKTQSIYAALHSNAALFVPEQFTYETERALSRMRGGLMGVQVLSVSRLRERVISSQEKPYLSPQGRRMVVRRAAYQLRSSLRVFGDAATRGGFAGSMDAMLSTCRQARLTPDYLREAAAKMGEESPLALKLLDVALIYEAVRDYLEKHYIDNEDAQDAICRMLPNSPLAGADIYFDGFEAVNEQLYSMLTVLMRIAKSVTFTICMDADEDARDAGLFIPERRVYERLRDIAASLGCTVRERVFHGMPLGKDAALVRLESDLFTPNPRVMEGEIKSITLVGASDRTAEVEALADAVCRAARDGLRYRDMAVIASDMHAYAPIVSRAFNERDIPLFLDARRSMQGHPVVELMLCAVKAASSLHCPELIRIMKTGLALVETDDAEAFENYCLMRGLIGGKVFQSPFPEDQEAAERARLALIPNLLVLKEGLKLKTAGEKVKAVYAYLERLDIRRQLYEESERLRLQGRLALEEEHAQVYSILIEMLEQLHAILGSVEMGAAEFLEVLSEALSAYQVGLIPATADQVLFGDFKRTRSTRLRALFLLGCNEGLMPAAAPDDRIIDDAELNELSEAGFSLWESVAAREQGELLLIYRALTKANESLFIGFAYTGGGKELLKASIVKTLTEIFPGLKEQAEDARFPETEKSGFTRLIRKLGEDDALTRALYTYYSQNPRYKGRLEGLTKFRKSSRTPGSLGASQAKRIYGGRYFGSVSRIETYKKCPYRYFIEHGLRVRPRREFGRKVTDVGSFSHMVLERFVKSMLEGSDDFHSVSRERTDTLINAIFADCLDEYEQGLLAATPRARVLSEFTLEALKETSWALVNSIRAGEFMPVSIEARFGKDGEYPAVELRGGGQLSGIIDRIDATPGGDYRVVDYKTGSKKLNFGEVFDGSSLQLPIYLAAVSDYDSPAGMYYQPVKDPVDEDAGELLLSGLTRADAVDFTQRDLSGRSEVVSGLSRNKGGEMSANSPLAQGEELKALIDYALYRADETIKEMLGGKIEARPVIYGRDSACKYCAYISVCRFDKRVKGCAGRRIAGMKRGEFFERIRGQIEKDE